MKGTSKFNKGLLHPDLMLTEDMKMKCAVKCNLQRDKVDIGMHVIFWHCYNY